MWDSREKGVRMRDSREKGEEMRDSREKVVGNAGLS